jgi:hypothetical protein
VIAADLPADKSLFMLIPSQFGPISGALDVIIMDLDGKRVSAPLSNVLAASGKKIWVL